MSRFDRARFALEVLLHGAPQPPAARSAWERAGAGSAPGAPPLPAHNPLEQEGAGARQAAALSMMDDDCIGFLLLTVVRNDDGAEVQLAQHLGRSMWPAIAATLELVAGVERSSR